MSASVVELSNGQSLNYFETGQEHLNIKPTLLFIHGNSSQWTTWTQTIGVLKQFNYHIVAVDQRGFGESTYKNKCSSLKEWAEDLVDFCKMKNIKQCSAIGWSFGGGVSMKLAEIAPQLITKVILTCSVSHLGIRLLNANNELVKEMDQIRQIPTIQLMKHIIQTKNRQGIVEIQKALFIYVKDYSVEKYSYLIQGNLKQRSYEDAIYALANSHIDVKAIKAKVLMVHGDHDALVPLETVRSTGEYFKNFEVWENHGHLIPLQDPHRYADTIRRFVDEF